MEWSQFSPDLRGSESSSNLEAFTPDSQVDVCRMRVVMALSGGMDPTALLLRMLARGDSVTFISYNYGQRHLVELERAQKNIEYLSSNGYNVEQIIVDLSRRMYKSEIESQNKFPKTTEINNSNEDLFSFENNYYDDVWSNGSQLRKILCKY